MICDVLSDPSQKLSLDLHLALISSDSWLHTPQHLALHNCGEYVCTTVICFIFHAKNVMVNVKAFLYDFF